MISFVHWHGPLEWSTVADLGFPRDVGVNPPGGANIRFCQIFPKTAWNWKNLAVGGGGGGDWAGEGLSKFLLCRSDTGPIYQFNKKDLGKFGIVVSKHYVLVGKSILAWISDHIIPFLLRNEVFPSDASAFTLLPDVSIINKAGWVLIV